MGADVEENWREPVIVGRFGEDGEDGLDGVAGADGDDGAGVEYIFLRTATPSLTAGQQPLNSWGFDSPERGWSDGAPSLTAALPYLWRVQRRVEGVPAFNSQVTDNWSAGAIVGRFGSDGEDGLDGVAGADGDDGAGVEYIFLRTATPSIPAGQQPLNSWGFDNPQSGWSDGAPSITASFPYLWRVQRRVEGVPAFNAQVSDNWSSGAIVGRYGPDGEDGLDGVAGADGTDGEAGDGVEYIFLRTADPTVTSQPSNAWTFDNPQSGWSDGAPSLSAAFPYLWRAARAVEGQPDRGDAVTDNWSNPVIVGR